MPPKGWKCRLQSQTCIKQIDAESYTTSVDPCSFPECLCYLGLNSGWALLSSSLKLHGVSSGWSNMLTFLSTPPPPEGLLWNTFEHMKPHYQPHQVVHGDRPWGPSSCTSALHQIKHETGGCYLANRRRPRRPLSHREDAERKKNKKAPKIQIPSFQNQNGNIWATSVGHLTNKIRCFVIDVTISS